MTSASAPQPSRAASRPVILLFGLPRSGTTWAGKIFDSHPMTVYRHEPDSWRRMALPLSPPARSASHYGAEVVSFVNGLDGVRAPKVVAKAPVFPKAYQSAFRTGLVRASTWGARIANRAVGDLPVLGVPRTDGDFRFPLVWKSIESLGRVGLLMEVLDHARLVHIVRHPCGYVASVLNGEARKRFDDARPSADDYGLLEMLLNTAQARRRGLTLGYMRSITPEERLAWRWVLFNEKAMEETAGNARCHRLLYEQLCTRPRDAAKTMLTHSGLSWDRQTEAFLARSTGRHSGSYYSVYKDPRKTVGRWREQLEPAAIARIMDVVADSEPGRLYADSSC